ncbi:TlpA family protein disulfide reductase [Nonlabens ponticola]|uniref:TlpA family protein disulfide reductase n=1 Tax=Nonlabens ponticola TaxID=2496866 RepID=A0A3S9MYJ4_9FLAO|nr:TlpA disulfide reductase family protein [Nonlabens ponticola]AZQ44227.1 TlpA family protein disulfide reductase [Nonlabens ponticola]
MKRLWSLLTLVLLILASCKDKSPVSLKAGDWRLTLDLGNGNMLPQQTSVSELEVWNLINDTEIIEVTEIEIKGDSIYLRPPVFEGYFAGVFKSENLIQGSFIKPSLNRVVPFSLEYGNGNRFEKSSSSDKVAKVNEVWEVVFSPEAAQDRYIAKGVFNQTGSKVTGTFETTTGDYRYLEGTATADSLFLSTFDGAHAFLFKAAINDDEMSGIFYSGNHWQEPFIGKVNADYQLPSATDLTYLKEGFDRFEFEFPNKDGQMVSLNDPMFNDKVVIVQLMGSWCPNCLDETRFYVDYINNKQHDDVQFVALAFEYASTQEKAFESIEKLKQSVGIPYPVLLAQHGNVDKNIAAQKLPMLNHVLSYPTSIFIDKSGEVRRIHTGYNGPATGVSHERFREDFYSFVDSLRAG